MGMDDKTNIKNPNANVPGGLFAEVEELRQRLAAKEKLASIGQLTAGILHEIKNPLNFINNFSRLSIELIGDLNTTLSGITDSLDKDSRLDIEDIAKNLEANINKVLENGLRAERIVYSMLAQASENVTIKFVSTDINQLVDDFSKLGYQGMRGLNKKFNLALRTDFDPKVGSINVDAPDLGRVILNIVNNACYALNEKKKVLGEAFAPEVLLSTKLMDGYVSIQIKDNGIGIPENVLTKIFQPFFTTKPTGEGTGLGLSMSNDIITNIHKGKLEVDSAVGEFTRFNITLPTNLIN
jgi:signal transduction histidine kinase